MFGLISLLFTLIVIGVLIAIGLFFIIELLKLGKLLQYELREIRKLGHSLAAAQADTPADPKTPAAPAA